MKIILQGLRGLNRQRRWVLSSIRQCRSLVVVILAMFPVWGLAADPILYVKPGAVRIGDASGSSWENAAPFPTGTVGMPMLINLYPGEYEISSVTFNAPVSIVGLGVGVTRLNGSITVSASGSHLTGFTLTGTGTGITITKIDNDVANTQLDNLSLSGFATGIAVNGTGKDNRIVNVDVSATGAALVITNAGNTDYANSGSGYISNSSFFSSDSSAVSFTDGAGGYWSIYSSKFSNSTDSAPCINAEASGNLQLANSETSGGCNIHISGNSKTQIDNHLFRNCSRDYAGKIDWLNQLPGKISTNNICSSN